MSIDDKPPSFLRFLPSSTLCLLLLGLVMTCSDVVAQETDAADFIVATSTSADPRVLNYYAALDDPEASRKALLTKVYSEIKYPPEARNSGTTGEFGALIYLTHTGEVDKVTVYKATETKLGDVIVVIGNGGEILKGDPVPDVLKAEIKRVLMGLDPFPPATFHGKTARSVLPVTIQFELED